MPLLMAIGWSGVVKEKRDDSSEFDSAIMIDFQGPNIASDTGFLLLRQTDDRFASWVRSWVNWRIPGIGFTPNTLISKWFGRGSIRQRPDIKTTMMPTF